MANVKRLRSGDTLENFLYDLLEMARRGEISNIAVATKLEDGEVMTGWHNLEQADRHILVGYQQLDIVRHMIEENY